MKSFRIRAFEVALTAFVTCLPHTSEAAQSVARKWNEVLLSAIRRDLARPTVTARTLFHSSVAAYDAWAAEQSHAEQTAAGDGIPLCGMAAPEQ